MTDKLLPKVNFEHKEIDIEGMDTLTVIEDAVAFNQWMYLSIKPFLKGKVLEIGSGIGNISTFANEDFDLTCSDLRLNYCAELEKKFPKNEVISLNIVSPNFETQYVDYLGKFDSIFLLNVVEHIKDDSLALSNCKKLLKNEGNLVVLVPAYQFLYNQFDTELEHFRRYTIGSMEAVFIKNQFSILRKQYFNFMGIFAWYFSGKLQKNKTIPQNQMKLYNFLVPIFKIIDKLVLNKIGLSVIVVGKK